MAEKIIFDPMQLREELHQIPELGFKEEKTSDYIADKLKELGLEPIRGIGGTGVVAYIRGQEPGPVVMLRADMDALPFTIDGKACAVHACGHDSHVAMLLATASRLIGKVKKGAVKLFFQPAEETLFGALRAIDDNVLEDIDYAFGAHVRPVQDIPDGTVCAAVNHTSSSFVIVELKGKTAHGARPHLGNSTVEAAVLATNAINAIWADPGKAWSAKVTTIDVRSGATNIIPDKGQMILDLRAQDNGTMKDLIEKVERAIRNACACVGVECDITYPGGVLPAAGYTAEETKLAEDTIKEVLGADKLAKPCGGGGEDFHYFANKKPGLKNAYIGVGAGCTPGLHDPRMTMNTASLENGVKVLEAMTLKIVG